MLVKSILADQEYAPAMMLLSISKKKRQPTPSFPVDQNVTRRAYSAPSTYGAVRVKGKAKG